MMKYIKFTPILLFSLLLMGCSNEAEGIEQQKEEVQFASGIRYHADAQPMTRTHMAFEPNVDLKIIVRDNNATPIFTNDVTTTAQTGPKSGDENVLTCTPKLFWNDLGGNRANLNVIGIHPHSAVDNITDDIITFQAGAIQTSGLESRDLMFASVTGYKYQDKTNPVSLNFNHALTKISITLKPNSYFNLNDLNNAVVSFANMPTQAKFDITDGSFTNPVNSSSVTPFKAEIKDDEPKTVAYSFTILAVPHTVTTGDIIATVTLNGNTYNVKPQTNRNLIAGEHTNFNVTITKTEVNATASIVNWNMENEELNSRLIDLGEFTVDAPDDITIHEGATITMQLTDKSGIVSVKPKFEYKKQADNSFKWEATTPAYWDDINQAITKVEALLITKPLSASPTGDHYFTGSITQDFSMQSTITLGTALDPFFKRPLSKISIDILTSTDTDKINIADIKTGSVIIPGCGTFKTGTDGVSIEMDNAGSDVTITGDHNDTETKHTCVTAYIYPQSLDELCHVTIGNNTYKAALSGTAKNFEAGKHYSFTVTITKSEVGFKSSIKDWETVNGGNIGTEL